MKFGKKKFGVVEKRMRNYLEIFGRKMGWKLKCIKCLMRRIWF
jgi:hypothetical protein